MGINQVKLLVAHQPPTQDGRNFTHDVRNSPRPWAEATNYLEPHNDHVCLLFMTSPAPNLTAWHPTSQTVNFFTHAVTSATARGFGPAGSGRGRFPLPTRRWILMIMFVCLLGWWAGARKSEDASSLACFEHPFTRFVDKMKIDMKIW